MDNSVPVQTATNLPYDASLYITSGFPNSVTITIQKKRFKSVGAKSLYSFVVTSNIALDSKAIYYFDFHMRLNSYLDNQGIV
jgi:hypothetical protein